MMENQMEKGNVINVYGSAFIGCTIHNAMFPSVVKEARDQENETVEAEDVEERMENAAEGTTPKEEIPEGTNYYAPQKIISVFLCQAWFDEVSSDKKKYSGEWRENLMKALLESEYKDEIAAEWTDKGKRVQMKCKIVGVLIDAEVLKGSYRSVAKKLGLDDLKAESLARYMSNAKKQPYYDWLLELAKK